MSINNSNSSTVISRTVGRCCSILITKLTRHNNSFHLRIRNGKWEKLFLPLTLYVYDTTSSSPITKALLHCASVYYRPCYVPLINFRAKNLGPFRENGKKKKETNVVDNTTTSLLTSYVRYILIQVPLHHHILLFTKFPPAASCWWIKIVVAVVGSPASLVAPYTQQSYYNTW